MVAVSENRGEIRSPILPSGDRRARAKATTVILSVTLLIAAMLSLGWGAASDTDVSGALLAGVGFGEVGTRDFVIVWDIRLPGC